jgi:murein DD-endopeptidase MepM/ murein hydrolase activator NlpD
MRVAHLLRPSVKGKYEKGQKLGETGSSGMSTGPHAHIEIWRGKVDVSQLKDRKSVMRWLEDPISFFTK